MLTFNETVLVVLLMMCRSCGRLVLVDAGVEQVRTPAKFTPPKYAICPCLDALQLPFVSQELQFGSNRASLCF